MVPPPTRVFVMFSLVFGAEFCSGSIGVVGVRWRAFGSTRWLWLGFVAVVLFG